jgi:U3 small nucleolar RNA-associated protein 25
MEDESGSEEEDEELEESGSEEEEDLQQKQAAQPYLALLQSFNKDASERNAKRRKLDDGTPAQEPEPVQDAAESSDDEDSEDGEGKDLDHVEEPEEDAGAALDGEVLDSDDEDEQDASDPFDTHFTMPDETLTAKRVAALKKNEWATKRTVSSVSRAVFMTPNVGGEEASLPGPIKGPQDLKLKHRVREVIKEKITSFTPLQKSLAPMLFGYQDMMYGERNVGNADALRQLVCLHAVNHIYK